MTRVELETVPTFDVRQDVHVGLPWDAVTAHYDEITASAYSVSLFTDWGPTASSRSGASPASRRGSEA